MHFLQLTDKNPIFGILMFLLFVRRIDLLLSDHSSIIESFAFPITCDACAIPIFHSRYCIRLMNDAQCLQTLFVAKKQTDQTKR